MPHVEGFAKDHYALRHPDAARVVGSCHCKLATAHQIKQFRCRSDAGVTHQLHGRGSVAAVYVDTAAAVQDGLDGLLTLRHI